MTPKVHIIILILLLREHVHLFNEQSGVGCTVHEMDAVDPFPGLVASSPVAVTLSC